MATLFRALAWPETPASDEYHLTFQCTNGVVVGLYAAHHYEPHFGLPSSGLRCVTLGVNLGSFDKCLEVNEALRRVDSSLKERAGVKRGFGLRFRGRRAVSGHGELARCPPFPRCCRFVRAGGRVKDRALARPWDGDGRCSRGWRGDLEGDAGRPGDDDAANEAGEAGPAHGQPYLAPRGRDEGFA